MSVYQPCDIRGPVTQLSASLYQSWGRVLGEQVAPGTLFLAGGDLRQSTPEFKESLISGLLESDIRVSDLGEVPTPMVYFAARTRHAAGCAIVTASHSPPNVNGLKWIIGALPPSEEDVQQLHQKATAADHGRARPAHGSRSYLDISDGYQGWLAATFGKASSARLVIVLDPKNGCWSERARAYLHYLLPSAEISTIHDQADGAFPDGNADCSRPEHLVALSRAVRDRKADLGIAFDGDGDRVAFVDTEGTALKAEEATWILLHSLGHELWGRPFVYDCKFSDRIAAGAAALGAQPFAERSGHSFIRRRMIQCSAAFGAEISGHYFYGALEGGDDGLFSACQMIRHLSEGQSNLTDLRRTCPEIHMTPDLRVAVESEQRDETVEHVRAAFHDYPQQQIDGVRVDFPRGWALVRKSVTDSRQLTFRFEGKDRKDLEGIVSRVADALPGVGAKLYSQYEQTR